jgi:hypothetical protein
MAWTKARKAKFQATIAAKKLVPGTSLIPLDAIPERKVISVRQPAKGRTSRSCADHELAVKLLEVATALLQRG